MMKTMAMCLVMVIFCNAVDSAVGVWERGCLVYAVGS